MTIAPLFSMSITVKTRYLAEQSSEGNYAFAYTIRIRNSGTIPAQLISRHWIITDANAQVTEVRGQGVVGEQPYLLPEHEFEYSSGTTIATRCGTMRGDYFFVDDHGEQHIAPIPLFSLVEPSQLN